MKTLLIEKKKVPTGKGKKRVGSDLDVFFEAQQVPLSRVVALEGRIRDLERELSMAKAEHEKDALVAKMTIGQLEEELEEQRMSPPSPRGDASHVRQGFSKMFEHILKVTDTDTPEGQATKAFFDQLFATLEGPPGSVEERDLVTTGCTLFGDFIESISDLNSDLQQKLNKAKKAFKRLRDDFEDACEKNKVLVRDHASMVEHCKETDTLFNEAADTIDKLKEDNVQLRGERESMIKEMEEAERLFAVLNTRLAWKSQAEEQRFNEDANKLNKLIANLRREKETYQTTALQSKRQADGLSVHVKSMRDELTYMRRELIEAREKIPRPDALIVAREIDESVDMEIAKSRRQMINDPDKESRANPDECRKCAILWLAKKHAETQVSTLSLKVTQIQHDYRQSSKRKDAEVEEKVRRGLKEAEAEKITLNNRERKRCDEIAALRKQLEQSEESLAEARRMNERRAQARMEEIERMRKETEEEIAQKISLRDGDRDRCGRLALHLVMRMVLFSSNFADTDADMNIMNRFVGLVDKINSLGSNSPECAVTYRQLSDLLSELPYDGDGTSTSLSLAIDHSLLAEASRVAPTYVQPDECSISMLLVDVLRPMLLLCSSYSSVDEWRTPQDKELISQRFSHLTSAVHRFQEAAESSQVTPEHVSALRTCLFEPMACNTVYFEWVVMNAIGCVGTNDYFANAMHRSLRSARKLRDELTTCNQKILKDIEGHIVRLMQSMQQTDDTSLHVLVRNEYNMMNALSSAVDTLAIHLSEAMSSSSVPQPTKSAINALQLAWTFVKKLVYSHEAKQPLSQKRQRLQASDGAMTTDATHDVYVRPESPYYDPGK